MFGDMETLQKVQITRIRSETHRWAVRNHSRSVKSRSKGADFIFLSVHVFKDGLVIVLFPERKKNHLTKLLFHVEHQT